MATRTSSATINYTLTNYAQGYANDLRQAQVLANALMPTVQVSGASGQYKKFDDVNSFQTYATLRGLGGARRRIEFGAEDGSFKCQPHGLEVTVDDMEREYAGSDAVSQQLLDQGKIKALISGASLSYTKSVVDFVAANTTAVASRGNWSNADVDPIDQIDEQIQNLKTVTGGFMDIEIVLGISAWRTLRNHPKTKARTTGVQIGGITLEQLSSMFFVPARPIVGMVSYNTAKPGNTVSKSQVLGDIVYIQASMKNPTIYDPSPFKCFATGAGGIESVKTYREERNVSDVHAVDWNEVFVATSTASIIRFNIT